MEPLRPMIVTFAARIGVDEPTFEDGCCAFRFDDHVLNFHVDDDRGTVTLFLGVADVPADEAERAALYRRLALVNAYGRRTGGGQLGVDSDERRAVFSLVLPAGGLSNERFEAVVEGMLDAAEAFQREFASPDAGAAAAPSGFAPPPAGVRA